MNLLIVLALAALYPAVHILNAWLFDFANINLHISLIYLPAFLRLFNLLVMGPYLGTLATLLGGVMLMAQFNEPFNLALLNVACSCAGPLIALMGFRIYFQRRVQLTSLKDLGTLTVAYALCNSLIHHSTWLLLNSISQFDATQAFWMFVGDLNGALLGAYLMKALLDYLERKGVNFSEPSQPSN